MNYRNSHMLLLAMALCLISNVCHAFTSVQKPSAMRTRTASPLALQSTISPEDSAAAAVSNSLESHHHHSNHKEPVDLTLVGSLACLATMGMLLGLSMNASLLQNIENTDNGSAATFIVDGLFGLIAVIVSLVSSGNEDQ